MSHFVVILFISLVIFAVGYFGKDGLWCEDGHRISFKRGILRRFKILYPIFSFSRVYLEDLFFELFSCVI